MIRTLIVDDEPIARQILAQYVGQIPALHMAGQCASAFEALDVLHRQPIDLLLLDIKMPALSGLDMLKTLQHAPKVILTTAFSTFAVESYEYQITDYLLKPISFERFVKAVNKVILPDTPPIAANIPQTVPPTPDFVFFKSDKKIYKFYHREILFFEGYGNYVKVHYSRQPLPILILDKLSELEQKLPSGQFCRIHKSFLINLTHISQVEGNTVHIGAHELPVGQHYREDFFRHIGL